MLWGPCPFLHDLCLEHLLGTGGGLEQRLLGVRGTFMYVALWPPGREVRVVASLHFSLVMGSEDGEGSRCGPPFPGLVF